MKCPKCNFNNPDNNRICNKCGIKLQDSEKISVSHTTTLIYPYKLTTGTTFAQRYQVIEKLGEGGMGRVYRVVDTKIKEEVALKLLKPEIASDEKIIERFSNELKYARKIVHKNVGRMYELLEDEGIHFITMEYVAGEDLKSFIRRVGQLPIGKSISIAKQTCEGLAEAHRLGVVHRDLKPGNIMIDEEGNARIMDFGIARSIRSKGITTEGMIIGTPEYMSPEQVDGKEVDQQSDIYSLGVILYEMLAGCMPFEGETPLSTAMKHKGEEPPDPRELNAQVPEDLSCVVLRCMEKDKEKRYQSVEELLSELNKVEKNISTANKILPKGKPIIPKDKQKIFGRRKLFILGLVCVFIAIIGMFMWQSILQKQVKIQNEVVGVGDIANPEAEFEVELWVDREDAIYELGEEIKFFFKCSKDCYLTLIDVSTSGQVLMLFPNKYHKGNKVKAGITYSIPGEGDQFIYKVQEPVGVEVVKAIATLDETVLYEERKVKPYSIKMPFSEFKESEEHVAKDIAIALKPIETKEWAEAEKIVKIVGKKIKNNL